MSNFIDRRRNGRNKSSVNRRKFLKRVREQIKKTVNEQIKKRKIKDIDKESKVRVNKKTISEPHFVHGNNGKRRGVHPGNKEYKKGDELKRPSGGEGGAGSEGSPNGDGEDDFIFSISRDEFLEIFFDDLELPDLVKTNLIQIEETEFRKAGFTKEGSPANLNPERSIQSSLMRKIALTGSIKADIEEMKEKLKRARSEKKKKELREKLEELERRLKSIPFIDDVDIRYNLHVREPKPSTNAVMFCLMDVSSSMQEYEKDIAKRFFVLLHLFLKRDYKKVDIVFLRHHHEAKEVNEEEFFYAVESGGTVVSRVLELMAEIVQERYPTSDWNIYAAQASDGDNWTSDSDHCAVILGDSILPYVQYFAYIEIEHNKQSSFYVEDRPESPLWKTYSSILANFPNLAMQTVADPKGIWHVFQDLFQKRGSDA
jgi:hypothetical protein